MFELSQEQEKPKMTKPISAYEPRRFERFDSLAEMEDRHHLTFDTYEEGKLTL